MLIVFALCTLGLALGQLASKSEPNPTGTTLPADDELDGLIADARAERYRNRILLTAFGTGDAQLKDGYEIGRYLLAIGNGAVVVVQSPVIAGVRYVERPDLRLVAFQFDASRLDEQGQLPPEELSIFLDVAVTIFPRNAEPKPQFAFHRTLMMVWAGDLPDANTDQFRQLLRDFEPQDETH